MTQSQKKHWWNENIGCGITLCLGIVIWTTLLIAQVIRENI